MKQILWNIAKAAMVGAIAGTIAALTLPTLATLIGVESPLLTSLKPAMMSLFMATTGAATVAISSMGSFLFGKQSATELSPITIEKAAVEVCHTPDLTLGSDLFCSRLKAERQSSNAVIGKTR